MSIAYEIACKYQPQGKRPSKSGSGWMMCCPAHGDKTPSAWISDNQSGIPSVKCMVGCNKKQIKEEMMRRGDWPEVRRQGSTAKMALESQHDYQDANGVAQIRIKRFKIFADGKKIPTIYVPDGHGDWVKSKNSKSLPNLLYNLPKVIQSAEKGGVICDVEGENKADLLITRTITATTGRGGTGNFDCWKNSKPEVYCKGAAFVAVFPDMDKPGFKFAIRKCRHYHKHGIPVKFFTFEEFETIADDGGLDVEDWLLMGKGDADEIKRRLVNAPMWTPEANDDFGEIFDDGGLPEDSNVVTLPVSVDTAMSPWSETALKNIFVEQYKEELIFVPQKKGGDWYRWNGKLWQIDLAGKVYELMGASVTKYYTHLWQTQHDKTECTRWLKKAQGRQFISNALFLARSHMEFDRTKFNHNPWILNCINGIIDLKTGELKPHDRLEYCTVMIQHEYKGVDFGEYPMFWDSLNWAFNNNLNMVRYLMRLAGYSATGSVREKKFFLFYGDTHSLKSTIAEAIQHALGPYSSAGDKRLITMVQNENKYSDPAMLFGKRLSVLDEIYKKDKIDEGKLRKLTGGDRIMGAPVFQDPFEFEPSAKLWVYGNEKPHLEGGTNEASWTRMVVVPFKYSIPESKKDKTYRDRMKASEASAILSWIVEGCLEWQAVGLGEPPEILEATSEYRDEMDIFKTFFEDCFYPFEESISYYEPVGRIYEAYQKWCKASGLTFPLTMKKFSQEIRARGFKPDCESGSRTRIFHGLRLLEPASDEPKQTRFYGTGNYHEKENDYA